MSALDRIAIMVIYRQQILSQLGWGVAYMRIGAARIRPRMLGYTLAFFFIASASLITQGLAADSTSTPSKESFNLILPFKDLTVGQGQEATMDAEVVNRTKDPVEISLQIEGVPAGWDVNFNSRYPSFPIRSVMVQGGDQTTNKSTTLEFKAKVPENTRPGNYPVKVTAKDHQRNDPVRRNHYLSRDLEESRDRRPQAHQPVSGLEHRLGSNVKIHGRSQKRNQQTVDHFAGRKSPARLERCVSNRSSATNRSRRSS